MQCQFIRLEKFLHDLNNNNYGIYSEHEFMSVIYITILLTIVTASNVILSYEVKCYL